MRIIHNFQLDKKYYVAILIGLISLVAFSSLAYLWQDSQIMKLWCADPLEPRDGQCKCPRNHLKQTAEDGTITCNYMPPPNGGGIPDPDDRECKEGDEDCTIPDKTFPDPSPIPPEDFK